VHLALFVQPDLEAAKPVRGQTQLDWLSGCEEDVRSLVDVYGIGEDTIDDPHNGCALDLPIGEPIEPLHKARVSLQAMKLIVETCMGGVCGGVGLTCVGDNDWQGLDRYGGYASCLSEAPMDPSTP
jgi:hypothetical protein